MNPLTLLERPSVASGPCVSSMRPSCELCGLGFQSASERWAHRQTDLHFSEAIALCRGAEWYACEFCETLVRGSLIQHSLSPEHVMHLPRQLPSFGNVDELLNWHGIRPYTTLGVATISPEVNACVNWEDMQRKYDALHRSLRLNNWELFSPAVSENKNEQDEKEPPPYNAPAYVPSFLSLAEVSDLAASGGAPLPEEPFYSPEPSEDEKEVGIVAEAHIPADEVSPISSGNWESSPEEPIYSDDEDAALMADAGPPIRALPSYALADPQHHLQVDSPMYSPDSDADGPEPPSYQGNP